MSSFVYLFVIRYSLIVCFPPKGYNSAISLRLRQAEIPIFADAVCAKIYESNSEARINPAVQICGGREGKGTCKVHSII